MSFADRMNDVLNKLGEAHSADVLALRARLAVAQRIVDAIPSCYPDGTAILSPEQWLAWAVPKLGYTHRVSVAPAQITCWGLSSFCAEVGHKCRAAGACVYAPPASGVALPDGAKHG